MDEDVEAAAKLVRKEWEDAILALNENMKALEACGSVGRRDKAALPRLNAAVQDRLTSMHSLIVRFEFLAQQLPSEEESEASLKTVQQWKDQYKALRTNARSANLKAKSNMEKAAKEERELLLGGGEEATIRRRNLQTQAGMASAAESITDGLRRTRQLMVQEVERGINTIQSLDDSNVTLRRAKDEYQGQRSLLNRTRQLLTSMTRSDVMDRVILIVGTFFFLSVCTYITLKRFGVLRLMRSTPPIYSTHVPMGSSQNLILEEDNVHDLL
ncbi:unnamed protein product [Calypogeia fissa]